MVKEQIINNLKSNPEIELRLAEFKQLGKQSTEYWFSELCFCILTANSKALTAMAIQKELGPEGFISTSHQDIVEVIRKNKHRFHNIKAKYIIEARPFLNIKNLICHLSGSEARAFIVKNIRGLGYKEASHFLRNVGFDDVAIIDRHILRYLFKNGLIKSIPKSISPQKYLEFEQILSTFQIPQSKLDLIIWEQMAGKVLK